MTPPNIPNVTIKPMINAKRRAGNQRDANIKQLKKQKALPMPEAKWQRPAIRTEWESAKKKVPAMQINIEVKMTVLTRKRSSKMPAGNKKITSA
ncbi:MAG: hypothetical protein ACD_44C00076G0001 [uncultured bacterium]|nr:MAG: hypothetical protein ACD_44C00076G0001 [uncultured bacterium]